MTIRDLKQMFPYIPESELKYAKQHPKYKTERGLLNHLRKENAENETKANKQDIVLLSIEIVWKRSRTWGMCPHAEYWVQYADGTHKHVKGISCIGCGYDKQSTVVAQIFNRELCGMLWRKRRSRKPVPYGISFNGLFPSFSGGIGVDCYKAISQFLGGKWRCVASSERFDEFELKF